MLSLKTIYLLRVFQDGMIGEEIQKFGGDTVAKEELGNYFLGHHTEDV